jgi:hypothetical protein
VSGRLFRVNENLDLKKKENRTKMEIRVGKE